MSVLTRILTEEEQRPPAELYQEACWYACHTRARHEKRVEQVLRERGIESYLPVLERESAWKDRTKVVAFPIFPGYVFGRFTLRELGRVLTVRGVATVVRANGYPTPVPDAELENVRRFVQALARTGTVPEPVPYLEEGRRVRVVAGPFRGVEGIVVENRGRRRVRVGLSTIGRGLEIQIAARLLKAVPGA